MSNDPTVLDIGRLRVRHLPAEPEGEEGGPAIVMVHGGGQDWWVYEEWMTWFSQRGYPVHALSLRGHGDSWPMPPEEFCVLTVSDYASDIINTCQSLRLSRPVLLGHSLGGIAAQLAAQQLDCSALVLVSSAGPALLGTRRGLLPPDRLVIRSAEEARARYFHSAPRHVVDAMVGRLVPESPGALNTSGGRAEVDPSRITCPVLALSGERDATDVPAAQQLAALYGGTALQLRETGHNIMQEATGQAACGFIDAWLRCVNFRPSAA